MAVSVVEVVSPVTGTTPAASSGPITTVSAVAVVNVVGPGHLANVVVSPTPPANPYEGQIWIDVS